MEFTNVGAFNGTVFLLQWLLVLWSGQPNEWKGKILSKLSYDVKKNSLTVVEDVVVDVVVVVVTGVVVFAGVGVGVGAGAGVVVLVVSCFGQKY